MTRYITGPEDEYGLSTALLWERFTFITGSVEGADDALAAVAEWLDTIRDEARAYVDKLEPDMPEQERTASADIANGFVQAISREAEILVTDSIYDLVDTASGEQVRRRILLLDSIVGSDLTRLR